MTSRMIEALGGTTAQLVVISLTPLHLTFFPPFLWLCWQASRPRTAASRASWRSLCSSSCRPSSPRCRWAPSLHHDSCLLQAVVGLGSSYQTPACTSMHAWLFPTSSVMLIPTRFPLLVVVQTSEKKSSDTLSFCKTLTDYSGEPIRLQVHTHTDTWM